MPLQNKSAAVAAILVALACASSCTTPPRGPLLRDAAAPVISQSFSVDTIRADLEFMARTIRATAPEGTLSVSQGEIDRIIEDEVARLSGGGDRRAMLPSAMRLAAAFRTYHVYVVSPHEDWNVASAAGETILADRVELGPNGLLLEDGRRLLSINGISGADLLAWFEARYDTHNPLRRPARLREASGSVFWVFGLRAPFALEVEDASGEVAVIAGREAQMPLRQHRLAAGAPSQSAPVAAPFTLSISADSVALVDIDSFDQRFEADWNVMTQQLQEALDAGRVRSITIDLRGNSGGSGRLAGALARLIAQQPVPMSGGKVWRRSPEYEAALAEFVPSYLRWAPWRRAILGDDGVAILDAIPLGQSAEVGILSARPSPMTARVPTAVLIDQDTGSSATQLARALQAYGLARLFGAPTADSPSGLGEIAFFRMPNSQLMFAAPSALFLDVAGDSSGAPVMPDVLICGGGGAQFAPDYADEAANGNEGEGVWRAVAAPQFNAAFSEADYCRGFQG